MIIDIDTRLTKGQIEAIIVNQIEEFCTATDDSSASDIEKSHINADELLCRLLNELGFTKVVDAWKKVEKYYV